MKYGNQIISSIRLGSQFIITKIMKGFEVVYEAWKKITKKGTSPLVLTNCKYNSSKLPGEYTQLEYIESTGAEYIDTGFVPTRTMKIEDTVSHITTDGTATLFGGSSGQQRVQVYHADDLRFAARAFASTPVNINVPNLTDKYTIVFDCQNTLFEVKDVDSKVLTIGSSGHTYPIALFGNNMEGTIATQSAHRRYSFKMWDNGVLQRDMIPCCRDLDGATGMYDLVNDVFYENKGSGAFIKGPEVTPVLESIDYTIYGGNDFKSILPDEYQQVEYIQTTGTQYIDSGVPLRGGLKTIVDWVYADADSGNNYVGGHIGAPGNRWLIGSQRQHYYYFGVGSGNSSTGIRFGNRDIVEAYWQNTGSYIKINNVAPVINSFDTLTLIDEPDYTFYMGALDRNGVASLFPKLIIYNWKFYQDDVLIRDFVPCYRKSDKVAGLYDVVTNEFYINNGTGEFIVGNPMLPTPTPDAPIEMKGVGDKSTNILNPDFSKTNAGTYSYILLSDMPKVLTLRLIDKDTSVDISNVSCGFTGNGLNANNDFHWCVAGGGVRDKFITNITNNEDSPVENPLMYFSVYPKSQATWEAVFKRFYIQVVEGEYTEATMPEYEPYGHKVPITVSGKNLVLPEPRRTTFCTYNLVDNVYHVETLEPPEGLSANVNLYFMIGKAKDLKGKALIGRFDSGVNMTYRNFVCSSDSEFSASGITSLGAIDTPCIIPSDLDDELYIGIRLYRQPQTVESFTISNLQVEIGEVVTDYEPYFTPYTTIIYLNQPINKAGTCVNSLSYNTQSITQLLGHYQFDGSENWEEHTTGQGCKVYRLDGVLTPKTGAFMSDTYMTHFGLTYTFTTADFIPGLYRFASGNPVDVISSSGRLYVSSACETVEEFKEWLSANRPSIYYPLAESETINVELPEVYLPGKTNIITVDTEVSPSEIEITYIGRE